jgi:hypothetical protein
VFFSVGSISPEDWEPGITSPGTGKDAVTFDGHDLIVSHSFLGSNAFAI